MTASTWIDIIRFFQNFPPIMESLSYLMVTPISQLIQNAFNVNLLPILVQIPILNFTIMQAMFLLVPYYFLVLLILLFVKNYVPVA